MLLFYFLWPWKVTVEQRPERDEGVSIADIEGKNSLDWGNSEYTGPVLGACWTCWMKSKEVSVTGEEQVGENSEMKVEWDWSTFWITGRTWAFILSKMTSIKRFWPKKLHDVTYILRHFNTFVLIVLLW